MYKFAIIGCGGLGARYIQSLAKFKAEATVYAVDVSKEALEKAKELFEGNNPAAQVKLCLCSQIEELDDEIDIAAVVTTSGIRRGLTEQLLNSKKVKYLILEKVLFPCVEDYEEIKKLLEEKNVKAWINCNRRCFPFYKELKKDFEGQKLRFILTGGMWGIGCNTIHYLDLINYITGSTEGIVINPSGLDRQVVESKRKGYMEFTGTIEGRTAECSYFSMTSKKGEIEPVIYTIISDEVMYVVNESELYACRMRRENHWRREDFTLTAYYQSTVTSTLFEEILAKGSCDLPDYETAQREHLPFIKAILEFLSDQRGEEVKSCPIT